ncbi:MAG: hypothetical protein JW395_3155 [Nitrospira sp.]|nr:hypothetical protein [Nitrospira sp.]
MTALNPDERSDIRRGVHEGREPLCRWSGGVPQVPLFPFLRKEGVRGWPTSEIKQS